MACPHPRSATPWLIAALLLGCRDARTGADPQSTSSSSSTSNETGLETSTSAAASSDSSGGNEATATGSSSSTADDSTGDPSGLPCEQGRLNLRGSLPGAPVDASFELPFGGYSQAPDVVFDFGWFGALVVHDVADPTTATSVEVTGALRMPDDHAASPGTWFCVGEGSTYAHDAASGATHLQLIGLAELGACPGTPVDGTVAICLGGIDCEVPRITSSVPAASFDTEMSDFFFGFDADAGEAAASFAFGDGGGWSVVHTAAFVLDDPAAEAAVDWAYFTVPAGMPDAGAVYCGTGIMRTNLGDPEIALLTSLSRVGSCADLQGDDALEICAQ